MELFLGVGWGGTSGWYNYNSSLLGCFQIKFMHETLLLLDQN